MRVSEQEAATFKAEKDLQDVQLDNRVIIASLEQRCHTAEQELDKARLPCPALSGDCHSCTDTD